MWAYGAQTLNPRSTWADGHLLESRVHGLRKLGFSRVEKGDLGGAGGVDCRVTVASRRQLSQVQPGQRTELSPDAQSGDDATKLRPHCDQAARDGRGQMPESDRGDGRWPGPTGTRREQEDGQGRVMADYGSGACWRAFAIPAVHPPLGSGGVASSLYGRSLLVVDLELVHTQPLYLKLFDLEPPDDRPPDRQTPDRQGANSASPNRRRPDRQRADANRAELLHARTAWGPPEWELEPVHARSLLRLTTARSLRW
jgi:hypothetical protein